MNIKHEYKKVGRKKKLVVTLPDGKEITVNDLMDSYGLHHNTAHLRLKNYIKTGNLKKLLKESQQKEITTKLSITHYEAGEVRMYKDEEWIGIMKALTNR